MKENIVQALEILTLIGSVLVVLFLFAILLNVLSRKHKLCRKTVSFLSKHYLLFGLIIAGIATLGSLFYSEIMGYNPCVLCWYQRIFMYPQTILFLIAFWKKNKLIAINSMILSLFGGFIAIYHYFSQIGTVNSTACNIVGYSAACSEFFSVAYGYITIPMMAIVAFFLLVALAFARLLKD